MESLFAYVCEHAEYAHLIIFFLILLTGISVPISEDVLLLIAGGIASSCSPDSAFYFYIWIFFACWFSAWEAYWIGRLLGPKLFNIGWFARIMTPERLEKLKSYYLRFGVFTFIVGRFIPGGVRNAIFMSSGLTKMSFPLFVARDGVACLIASSTIFYLGYVSGKNIDLILKYFVMYERVILGLLILLVAIAGILIYYYNRKQTLNGDERD